jgi:chloramphenicol 3-O-phosphotransferase
MIASQAPGSWLLLTGPPASGKSTVARAVADTACRPTVHMHTDTFYAWIRAGSVLPYLPAAARQNEVVMQVIVAAAAGYARGGYDVVLDGIIGPWSLPPLVTAAAGSGIGLSCVVLRPRWEVVLDRANGRTGEVLRDIEPIRGLYGAFAALGDLERCVLDPSDQSPEQTAAEVRQCAHDPRHVLVGS